MIKIATIIKTYRLIILTLLSSLLVFSSWPPSGFFPLIFVAFIPLLFIEEFFVENKHLYTSYRFFIYIFCSFLISNILLTYWIANSSVLAFITAIVLNSFFMSMPWLFMHVARRSLPGKTGPLMLVFLWVSFEFLHLNWELSWPWLNLGNVFAANPGIVQWYEYTGALGGTVWILITNILGFYILKSVFAGNIIVKKFVALSCLTFILLLVPILISYNIGNNYTEKHNPVEIVIVQPNHDPYIMPETMPEVIDRLELMIELASQKTGPETSFIISPEASIYERLWINHAEANPSVSKLRLFSRLNNDVSWVAGAFLYRMYYGMDKPTPTSAMHKVFNEYYDTFNSAIMIEGSEPMQHYHKSKLVPGIESLPFYSVTRYIAPIIERLGGTGTGLGKQKNRTPFVNSDSIIVAPIICYESVFGEYVSKYVRNGAQLLFIITNDGWWGKTSGYRQHFHYARLRAIETRRSIARSASTGISGFIDQKGDIQNTIDWNTAGAISQKINANDKITFYVYNGDFIGRLSVFFTILIVLYVITQKMMRR